MDVPSKGSEWEKLILNYRMALVIQESLLKRLYMHQTSLLPSVAHLNIAKCGLLFKNGICKVTYPDGKTMATIPRADGLYRIIFNKLRKANFTNVASIKMSIREAHQKLGHIVHAAIKHMVRTGMVTGI